MLRISHVIMIVISIATNTTHTASTNIPATQRKVSFYDDYRLTIINAYHLYQIVKPISSKSTALIDYCSTIINLNIKRSQLQTILDNAITHNDTQLQDAIQSVLTDIDQIGNKFYNQAVGLSSKKLDELLSMYPRENLLKIIGYAQNPPMYNATYLASACTDNNEAIVEALLPYSDLSAQDERGNTALIRAAANPNITQTKIIQLLIQAKSMTTDIINLKTISGNNALRHACQKDNFKGALLLYTHGADITSLNKYGYTPLSLIEKAALAGNKEAQDIVTAYQKKRPSSPNLNAQEPTLPPSKKNTLKKICGIITDKFDATSQFFKKFYKARDKAQ